MKNCEWYATPVVAWNICKACWNREVSINAKSLRDGREFHKKSVTMTNINYVKATLANPREKILDVFTGLCEYDLTPVLGTKWGARKKFFAETTPSKWIMAFDFDSEDDIFQAGVDCFKALEWLARIKPEMKFSIKYSGGKGFHIETNKKLSYEDGLPNNRILAESIKLALKLDTLDMAIYTPRREWRAPWTIHHSGRVAYPMTLDEFLDFMEQLPDSQRWLTPKRIYKTKAIKDQGFKWLSPRENGFWLEMNRIKEMTKA